jgi:hypothetical protein
MNFIKPNTTESDKELFFGPLENETFTIIEDHWNMAHIIHKSGLFPSVGQARKNGWNKPIPDGFTLLTVGKKAKRKDLFILGGEIK